MNLRENLQKNGSDGNPLVLALTMSQRFDATDDRDKVYALLSSVCQAEAEKVEVNYRDPADRISLQVSNVLIQQGHTLGLLHHTAKQSPRSACSWAVGLKTGPSRVNTLDHQVRLDSTCFQFQACADTRLKLPLVSMDSKSLELAGFLLEKIVVVSESFPEMGQAEATHRLDAQTKLSDWYNDTLTMIERVAKDTKEDDLETRFIAAAVAEGRLHHYAENDEGVLPMNGGL